MFTWLRSLFSSSCVVELSSQRLLIRDLSNGQQHEFSPVLSLDASNVVASIGRPVSPAAIETFEPFASSTALVKNARVAELLLQYAFSRVGRNRWIKPAPSVVLIVPQDRANALALAEDSVLLNLSARAGAWRTVVHRGSRPSDEEMKAMLNEA
jgi:hypothetical protein